MNSKKIFAAAIVLTSLATSPITAQEATSGADSEATDAASLIRQEVTRIVQEQENPETKKAFTGEITDIFNSTIVLETDEGKKTVKVEDEAIIISNNQNIDFQDLEISSWVIAMGYLDETDLLNGKRIVVSTKPAKQEREALIGEVIETENEKLIIKTLPDNEPAIIVYDETTLITDNDNKKIELEVGQTIVAAGTVISDLKINAGTIKVISLSQPAPEAEIATKSAQNEE